MKRLTIVLVASAALALGLIATAENIGVTGVAALLATVPNTQFQGPSVAGALDYNVTTHTLTLNLADGPSSSPFSTRFVPSGSFRPHHLAPTPNALSITIRVLSNDGGTYAGGVVANDLALSGSVDVNGNGVIDPGESGPLLTGSLLQFGFNNLPDTPSHPGGTPDTLDFRFAVTGGILAPLYAGKDIGVVDSMTSSTWSNGDIGGTEFRASFQGNALGNIVPIPCGGSIGDFVWDDGNRNGVQDPGEPGLNGVTIRLRDASNTVIRSGSTGPGGQGSQSGFYNFEGLCRGSYTVEVDEASAFALGFVPTTSGAGGGAVDSNANFSPVTLAAGNYVTGDQTVDFGFKSACTGTIGDRVWHDLNRNGLQDPGDPGVQGWAVRLSNAGGTQIGAPIATGPGGSYHFVGLCAGSYRVDVAPLPGFALTFTNQGSDRAVDSNIPQAEMITLDTDFSTDSTIDFGYTGLCEGTIGDYVWFDADHDGVQDADEPGIDGLTVTLNGPGGTKIATTGVNPGAGTRHGFYQFTGACTGTYTVDVQAPAGFTPSADNAGDDRAIDSNGPVDGGVADVTLADDLTVDTTIDFGFVSCPGQIGDLVWQDTNLNGVQDPGEPGYPGVVVNLRRPLDNAILQSTITGLDGKYFFSGRCPADYLVEVVPPAGTTASPTGIGPADRDSNVNPSPVTLTVDAGVDLSVDFGYMVTPPPTGRLVSFVWNDLNNNGLQEFGEPGLAGAPLTISGPNLPVGYAVNSVSDADGFARFAGLPAGTYTLTLPVLPGFFASPTGQGVASTTCPSGGGTGAQFCDSNGSPGGGEVMVSAPVTLATNNSADETIDFGLYTPESVGGNGGFGNVGNFLWLDRNGNGLQDTGEPGVPGVTVNITGPGGFAASTTTDANGKYLFRGLMPATYQIAVVATTAYGPTKTGQGNANTVCAGGSGAALCDSNPSPATVTVTERMLNLSVDFGLEITPPALSLVKTVDQVVAIAGSNLVYTLTYKNSGGTPAAIVTISDKLQPATTFVSATGGGVYKDDTVTWTIPTLAAGATGSVTLTIKLPPAYQACHAVGDNDDHERKRNNHHDGDNCEHERWKGCFSSTSVTNDATIKSKEKPSKVTSNTVTTTVGTTANPILVLAKVVNKATANPGDTLVYTLAGKNVGNATETNIVVTDVLPAGTTFVSATNGGVHSNGTVTWRVPSVPPNGTQTGTLTVKLNASFPLGTTTISNTYTVTSTQIPTPVESLAAVTTVTVVPKPVLTLTKSVSAATISKGGTLVYTLAYQNTGTVPATSVVLNDVLPDKTSFTSATGGGINGSSSAGVKWALGTVAAGASGSVTVTVKVANGASKSTLTNTARISSAEITTPVVSNAVTTKVN